MGSEGLKASKAGDESTVWKYTDTPMAMDEYCLPLQEDGDIADNDGYLKFADGGFCS